MKLNINKILIILAFLILILFVWFLLITTKSLPVCISIVILSIPIIKTIFLLIETNILMKKYDNNQEEIEYFRDIPDEKNATPSRAVYLYNYINNESYITGHIGDIFSATIIDFSLKGLLKLKRKDNNKFEVILVDNDKVKLSKDEIIIYEIFKEFFKSREYTKNNYDNIIEPIITDVFNFILYKENRITKMDKMIDEKIKIIEDDVKSYCKLSGILDDNKERNVKKLKEKNNVQTNLLYILIIFLFFFLLSFTQLILVGFLVLPIVLLLNIFSSLMTEKKMNKISVLSDNGYRLQNEWRAFRKFICDYSLLNERKVEDKILWEKYLVYATALGVSKETIKELRNVDLWDIFEII